MLISACISRGFMNTVWLHFVSHGEVKSQSILQKGQQRFMNHEPEQLFLMLCGISCEKVPEVPISQCLRCLGSAEIQKPEHYNAKNHP